MAPVLITSEWQGLTICEVHPCYNVEDKLKDGRQEARSLPNDGGLCGPVMDSTDMERGEEIETCWEKD
jgi:hypothetical protein